MLGGMQFVMKPHMNFIHNGVRVHCKLHHFLPTSNIHVQVYQLVYNFLYDLLSIRVSPCHYLCQ